MSRSDRPNPPHRQGGGHRQGEGGQRQAPPPNQTLREFARLVKDEKRSFTHDKVMEISNALGKSLTVNPFGRQGEGKENTKSQVRKFYNLVRVANLSAAGGRSSVESIKVKLRSLQAQVAYAVARKTISPDFKEFFDVSLNQVISSDNPKQALADFATFFEALYAYFYFHTEVRR